MRIAIVGSIAAKKWFDSYRDTADVDIVATYDDAMSYLKLQGQILECYPISKGNKLVAKMNCEDGRRRIFEVELAWAGSLSEELLNIIVNDPKSINEDSLHYAHFEVLYMLKMSHRFKKNSPHFLKTMEDIHQFREITNSNKIHPDLLDFFKRREAATYDYSHPKLNVEKNDFFNSNFIYTYDHDSIHEAIKHLEYPAYTYFKPENSDVMCDKDMFFASSKEIRQYAVLEEAYVLALERSYIPYKGSIWPGKSFDIALEKVCTSITSGWFREYAWENYYKISSMSDYSFITKFNDALKNGKILPFES